MNWQTTQDKDISFLGKKIAPVIICETLSSSRNYLWRPKFCREPSTLVKKFLFEPFLDILEHFGELLSSQKISPGVVIHFLQFDVHFVCYSMCRNEWIRMWMSCIHWRKKADTQTRTQQNNGDRSESIVMDWLTLNEEINWKSSERERGEPEPTRKGYFFHSHCITVHREDIQFEHKHTKYIHRVRPNQNWKSIGAENAHTYFPLFSISFPASPPFSPVVFINDL